MSVSLFKYKDFLLAPDRKKVDFTFTVDKDAETFEFRESYEFESALPDSLETYRLLKALHLASGISYYKILFSDEIEHPYAMSTREAVFWNNVFKNGLGEFLYNNKLDPSGLAVFGAQEGHDSTVTGRVALQPQALLGIGGGKDSIVAGEILKVIDVPLTGFVMATREVAGQAEAVAHTMKINIQKVQRILDPSLLTVQERPDAYKGHIPISLIFALVGSLLAVTNGSQYVVVANEDSASIAHVEWAGSSVNHQWSKSFEFEKELQSYLKERVNDNLYYFSAIRPLSSVAVAKIFSKLSPYFKVFTSDNYVFRIDPSRRPNARWSTDSPKSLSSYILLSAWLNETQLLTIFDADFLNNRDLQELFLKLLGVAGEQVLDCVGTPDELRASLQHAYLKNTFSGAYLMLLAAQQNIVGPVPTAPDINQYLPLRPNQAFPPALADKLQQALSAALA